MKRLLLAILLVLATACTGVAPRTPAVLAVGQDSGLLAQWPGTYDNHAQVWQAQHAEQSLLPPRVHQRITPVPGQADSWDWRLEMSVEGSEAVTAHWRYTLRSLPDGRSLLMPSRALPGAAEEAGHWAELAPCAMQGGTDGNTLRFTASEDACSAILASLGRAAALMPLILEFDGKQLIVQTYADISMGKDAHQIAQRVHVYHGWAAINGAGPEAAADSTDWHFQREIELGNQGQLVPIRWRDGSPSGYALRLETLDYSKRGLRILRLSLLREADDSMVAYAWADPGAEHIGLNLGWVQVGLSSTAGDSALAP